MTRVSASVLLLFSLAISAAPAGENEPKPEGERVVKASASCYQLVRSHGRSNAGFIVGRDAVMVIDCLDSPDAGKRLMAEVRRVSKKPVRYVVLTHGHYDHSIGNQSMPKDAKIVASAKTADWLAKRLIKDRMLFRPGVKGGPHGSIGFSKVRGVDESIEKHREIDLGDLKVQLVAVGDCHAAGDLVVHVPSEKVMYTGDLVWNGYHPNLSGGGTFLWLTRLAVFQKLDLEKVLPGHGEPGGKELLKTQQRYLMDLRSLVKHLLKRGVEPKKILEQLEVPKVYAKLGYKAYWKSNVKFVAKELVNKR